MVGVPRSKGCQRCIQRRVKCDEARPQCRTCERYGAPCPGYDRGSKFVTEKHKVRPRRAKVINPEGNVKEADRGPTKSSSSSASAVSPPDGQATFTVSRTIRKLAQAPSSGSTATTGLQPDPVPMALALKPAARAQFICTMLDTLYAGPSAKNELHFLNSWFDGIQCRLGAKVTLDASVTSLVLQVLGKARGDDQMLGESRALYGRSLMALQSSLHHETEWKSSETLCATTLLCIYEQFAGTSSAVSWMQHATGISALIEQRGPQMYEEGWDRALFKNLRPFVILNSFFDARDCFLAQPRWQRLMKGLTARAPDESNYVPGAGSDSELRRELGMMADVYFALFAKLPGVLRLGFPMREAKKHGMPLDRTDLALLHQRTASLYRELQDWAVDLPRLFPAPTEVPSQDPGSLFPTVLRYDNVWYGPLYMGYWATLLVVQWSLALSCEELGEACPPFALSSDELVRSILRSLETVGEGVMGGYRIGYSVRVVYDFADLPTQLWIRTLLQGHEKVFAGLRVDAFPSAGSNAMTG